MEQNTVVLSLQTYNDLKKFKEAIEKGHTVLEFKGMRGYSTYMSTDAAVQSIAEQNHELVKQLQLANIEIARLQLSQPKKLSKWGRFVKWVKGDGLLSIIAFIMASFYVTYFLYQLIRDNF